MKNFKMLLLSVVMITGLSLPAQVAVNTDGSNPDASAMLDVNSSNKGILIPRVTQSEIEAIANPANGLMVFNTDANKLFIYIASEFKWKEVLFGSGEILYPASLSIGTGGSCANTTVSGFYIAACELLASQSVSIEATVSAPGAWSIYTDTVNGYSFSGSGIVSSTGTVQLTLNAHGTPVTPQVDAFTATVTFGGSSSCTFNNTVTNCDDNSACTDDFCDPVTGCYHVDIVCDDGNACTDDYCDPQSGCYTVNVVCDDGDPCTDDFCDPVAGCQSEAVDCDDGDPCTTDYCDPITGCQSEAVDCDDGNACTDDTCDPVTGECVHTQIDCDDGDPNTTDGCDPSTGCTHTLNSKVKRSTDKDLKKKK